MGAAVHPIGVGGPRSTELDTLSKRLGCPAEHDFRKLRIDRPAAFILVLSLRDAKLDDLVAAADAGTRILTLEPPAAEWAELDTAQTPGQPGAITTVPAFTRCPGFLDAADPHEQLTPPQLVRFSSLGRPTDGSLLARLVDAWLAVLEFTELPETVTASLSGPAAGPRQISGLLAAHATTPQGGAVLLEAANAAPQTRRELSVLSRSAHLRVTDDRYQLLHADGHVLDASEPAAPSADHAFRAPTSFADLVTHQWGALLHRPPPPPQHDAQTLALACVHACLLSAKTGQPERPATLLSLARS